MHPVVEYIARVVLTTDADAGDDVKVEENGEGIKVAALDKTGALSEAFQVEWKGGKYFVKMFPQAEVMRDFARVSMAYPTEVRFYRDILPQLANLYPGAKRLVPGFCAGSWEEDPAPFLMLEDLQVEGFSVQDKNTTLRSDLVYTVLKALGEVHCLGYILNQLHPSLPTTYPELDLKNKYPKVGEIVGQLYIPMYIELLKQNNHPVPNLISTLQESFVSVYKELQLVSDPLATLAHGDLWINNLMFSQDGSQVKLVDWQLMRLASLGTDFNFFLVTCVSYKQIAEEFEALVETYYTSFTNTFTAANTGGLTCPTLLDVTRDISEKATFGLIIGMISLPFLIDVKTSLAVKEKEGSTPSCDNENGSLTTPEGGSTSSSYCHGIGERERERMLDVYRIAKFLKVF